MHNRIKDPFDLCPAFDHRLIFCSQLPAGSFLVDVHALADIGDRIGMPGAKNDLFIADLHKEQRIIRIWWNRGAAGKVVDLFDKTRVRNFSRMARTDARLK